MQKRMDGKGYNRYDPDRYDGYSNNRLASLTDDMEEVSRMIRQTELRMESCGKDLASIWKDEAAGIFLKKLISVNEEIGRVSASISEDAEMIREKIRKDRIKG